MVNDSNLQFIREKVGALQNAVMYVSCNGLVKLGNDIVTAVKVDEDGILWFVTNRPAHMVSQCEQSFPARLRFYRKGVDYLLRTQLEDGTWFVRTRAFGFQPYFETGFPHGRSQFISTVATAWASAALTYTLEGLRPSQQ